MPTLTADTPTDTHKHARAPHAPADGARASEGVVRAVLAEKHDDHVVLSVPGTDYRVRLVIEGPIPHEVGKRIRGVVRAQARRIDVVTTGGRFVEPVYGRPRRIQGKIIAIDPAEDTVTVEAHTNLPIVCRTNGQQRATQFKVGQLVSFDAQPGAAFAPVG